MEAEEWAKIQEKYVEIVRDLEVRPVLPYLIQSDVFSLDDEERVLHEATSNDKAKKLLNILESKHGGYKPFYTALRKKKPFLADILRPPCGESPKDPVKHLRSSYREDSKGKVSCNEIRTFLFEYTGERCDEKKMQMWVEQAFELAQFTVEGKKKKTHYVLYISKREMPETERPAQSVEPVPRVHAVPMTDLGTQIPAMQILNVEELCLHLKNCAIQYDINLDFLETIRGEAINGRVFCEMSEPDFKEVFPGMPFGHRKLLHLFRTEYGSENAKPVTKTENRRDEFLEEFDKPSKPTSSYKRHSLIRGKETRITNMIRPVDKFVDAQRWSSDDLLSKMATEAVHFGAACLNSRTNGTIHFGIANDGEVLGIQLEEKEFKEIFNRVVKERFFPDQHSIVKHTIRPPRFVEVQQAEASPTLYVVEVDVVPSFSLIGEEAFFLRAKGRSEKGRKGTELLELDGEEVKDVRGDDLRKYMERKRSLSQARNDEECKAVSEQRTRRSPDLRSKFIQLFSGGMDSLDYADIYPILVCGKPDERSRPDVTVESFAFLKRLDWTVVFDTDDALYDESLYNLYENRLSQTTTVLTSDDFDPRFVENMQDQNRLKKLYEELKSSLHPPWVFLNGYSPLSKEPYAPSDWKTKRSVGFKEVLRFYHNEIPNGRAVVMILLLGKDQGVLPQVCDQICELFQDQWMAIAENNAVADSLKLELVRRDVNKETIDDRFVVGIPWPHVCEMIRQLKGTISESECSLTTSSGAYCVLKEKIRGKLSDLNIISCNQCEDYNSGGNEIDTFSRQEEVRFYKGDEASWWNFWFKNHVCQRKQHGELINQVRRSLDGDIRENDKVGRVHFYHHPGSGGTTSAKHVLWELRKEYRCCVVKQLSDQTCEQISRLRVYEDTNKPKPVLILVDNLDEERVDQLYAELEEAGRQSIRCSQEFSVFCVMLICYRRTKSAEAFQRKLVWLTHDLPKEELLWFKKKYAELEKHHREKKGVDPTTLIAFNIMKENFNPDYIKKTVGTFLEGITDARERTLLKYVSLINSFDIDFQPVPLSSFDPIMGANKKPKWETQLSICIKVLLNKKNTQGLRGQIQGLRVLSALISREILLSLLRISNSQEEPQTVSDAMMELLNSSVLTGRDNCNQQMWKLIRNLVKKREWLRPGRLAKFSPLIMEICEKEGFDEAAEVMTTVFKRTDDPMVAQGIARLYIQAKNWNMAKEFAKTCTNMRPFNSCVWDTYGQVFKNQIEALYNSYIANPTNSAHAPQDCDLQAIDNAFDGIEIFRNEQKLSKNEKTMSVSNKVGYFSELQITILLLDLLSLLTPFENKAILHKFLVDQSFVPPEAERQIGPQRCERFKSLYKDSCAALMCLEDEFLHLKDGTVDDYRRGMHKINRNRLIKLKEYHDTHFGEGQGKVPENMSLEDAAEFRRRRVIRLGGLSLGKILDIRDQADAPKTLCEMHSILLHNISSPHPQIFDFKGIIGVCLALSTINPPQIACTVRDLIEWSRRLYFMVHEDDRIELEQYLYMVMFHWPTGDQYDEFRCPAGTLQTAIAGWKEAFHSKYPWQREGPPIKRKETTIYHLGMGSELDQYTHFEKLHGRQGRRIIKRAQIWTNPDTARRLRVLTGTLINHGNDVQIQIRSTAGSVSTLTIPSGMPIHEKHLWNKRVFFFLGFSWAGPRAFGVTDEDPRQLPETQASLQFTAPARALVEMPFSQMEPKDDITTVLIQLREIAGLKHIHRQRGYLPPQQWNFVKREADLRRVLNELVSRRREVFEETQQPYTNF